MSNNTPGPILIFTTNEEVLNLMSNLSLIRRVKYVMFLSDGSQLPNLT